MEIFKKIVESGWIVGKAELKQIFEFVELTRDDIEENENLLNFLKTFVKELNFKEELIYQFIGDVANHNTENSQSDFQHINNSGQF